MCVSKSNKGFSLIELSIVIVILGAVLTPLFAFLTTQQSNDQQREEEALNERVLASLALYLRQNGVYPCPADPALGPGAANFGRSMTGASCAATGSVANAGGVSYGALPVHELNLPFNLGANTHNWKFIYAVTIDLTDSATFDGQGNIQILDASGAAFGADQKQFVIVNPGEDGKGVWALNGTTSGISCGTTALDADNCNTDGDFIEANYSPQGGVTSANYYDDNLSYSLIRKESTFWVAQEDSIATGTSGISIVNRNQGNVGIGNLATAPSAKLHVFGGDILVQSDSGTGGNIEARGNITSTQTIRSENNIVADNVIRAPTFFYE